MYLTLRNVSFENLVTNSDETLISYHGFDTFAHDVTIINCTFDTIESIHSGSLDIGGLFSFVFDSGTRKFIFNDNIFSLILFDANDGCGSILYFIGTNLNSFSFQNNQFIDISSAMKGVLYLETGAIASEKFSINACTFTSCTSSYGGAIYFRNVLLYFFFFFYCINF
jgi:hypothetical protein